MSVWALGINHHTAPLDLRGRFAFALDQIQPTLHGYRQSLARQPEATLLSTCNRTELYGAGDQAAVEPTLEWLAHTGGVSTHVLRDHAYVLREDEAARHAFRVASGLDSMVGEFFGLEMNKKFQKADWGKRPLTKEMLDYAASDTIHLKKLRDLLGEELVKKGRMAEAMSQFENICKIEPTPMRFDESGFLTLKGARQLNGRGLAVLRELYIAREVAAIKKNTPPFKVISEDLMLRLSVAPREGLHNLSIFKGVSGYVLSNHGPWIREALQKGLNAPPYQVPHRDISREKRAYFETVKNKFRVLKLWRKETAARRNMLPEAIMGNDILERLATAQLRSVADIQAIKGVGAEKSSLYAAEIIEFLKKHHAGK